jgi:hypothetical protein
VVRTQGATVDDMAAAAASTTLQPACAATLSSLQAAGVPLRVLSANWVRFLGDAKSSLGDAKSSLGDAKSSLGDAKLAG